MMIYKLHCGHIAIKLRNLAAVSLTEPGPNEYLSRKADHCESNCLSCDHYCAISG